MHGQTAQDTYASAAQVHARIRVDDLIPSDGQIELIMLRINRWRKSKGEIKRDIAKESAHYTLLARVTKTSDGKAIIEMLDPNEDAPKLVGSIEEIESKEYRNGSLMLTWAPGQDPDRILRKNGTEEFLEHQIVGFAKFRVIRAK